uniref:Uncharacterized protein n=1 Tax=Anguilla anguilla TaxID=7936 RepID=A0A0E9V4B1_ANGAN
MCMIDGLAVLKKLDFGLSRITTHSCRSCLSFHVWIPYFKG